MLPAPSTIGSLAFALIWLVSMIQGFGAESALPPPRGAPPGTATNYVLVTNVVIVTNYVVTTKIFLTTNAVVAFGGVGSVAREIGKFDKLLPSIGGGLRYVLAKNNNVSFRFDAAWGRDEHTFQVGVGEAF